MPRLLDFDGWGAPPIPAYCIPPVPAGPGEIVRSWPVGSPVIPRRGVHIVPLGEGVFRYRDDLAGVWGVLVPAMTPAPPDPPQEVTSPAVPSKPPKPKSAQIHPKKPAASENGKSHGLFHAAVVSDGASSRTKKNATRRDEAAVKEAPAGASERTICDYKEAMALTGLRKTKLYDLFSRGVLRGYRDGTMIRFYRESLLAYMKERENVPAPPPPAPKPIRRSVTQPPGQRLKFL